MTCTQCGAAVRRGDGRFCSHCAAALPDRPRITPDEWPTHVERFEQAERDPQHAAALGLAAPEPAIVTTIVAPALFLVAWVVMGAIVSTGFAEGGGPMFLFPVLLMIGGAVGIGSMIVKGVRKARAPVEREVAVVVDERTEISSHGSGDDRRTSTSYYATLQFKGGARLELPTPRGVAGFVTRGDLGLAVMRDGDLVDFHRYQL